MWGHSGGGFIAADAMFRYPDFFKVGISESGNHDQRVYEDDWGERYQGLLVKGENGAPDNYDVEANQTVAKNLKGKLLLAARHDGRQRAAVQHATSSWTRSSRRTRTSTCSCCPRSARLRRRRAVHDAAAVGLLREAPARRRAAEGVQDDARRAARP